MNRWRVIFAAAVIFIAGAAAGGVVGWTYAPKTVKRTQVSPPLPISHDRREEYVAKLDKLLTLKPEQRTQIEQIVAASQKRMKELWEPMEPQVKEEYRRTRREINEVLSAEQQEKFQQWRKERENKDRNKESGAPGEKPKACIQDLQDLLAPCETACNFPGNRAKS